MIILASVARRGVSAPFIFGSLSLIFIAGAVWLQLQNWVQDDPLWIRTATFLPEGTTPFGAVSKIGGLFGLLALALLALGARRQSAPIEDEALVAPYGVAPEQDRTPAKRRPVVDFHAMAKSRAGETVHRMDVSRAPKRRMGALRLALILAVLAALFLVGAPMVLGAAGGTAPEFDPTFQDARAFALVLFDSVMTGIRDFDFEAAKESGRATVQGAMSGQLEPQVQIGLSLGGAVWSLLMLRATFKLLFGRRRRPRPSSTHLQYN